MVGSLRVCFAAAILGVASPASAAITISNYDVTSGSSTIGNFSLAFDDSTSTYRLDDLAFEIEGTAYDEAGVVLEPIFGDLLVSLCTGPFASGCITGFDFRLDPLEASQTSDLRYWTVLIPAEKTILITQRAAASVPEPGTWLMILVGFAAVGAAMRRQRKRVILQAA